jgi:hypothetical protein
MVIVLKDKDSVWMGASIEGTFTAMHNDDIISEDNLKMWNPAGRKNCLFATATSSMPLIDDLRYADFEALDLPPRGDVVIRNLAPEIKDFYAERRMLDNGALWEPLAVAKEDRAFIIDEDLTVIEVEEFDTLEYGFSGDITHGVLETNRDLPPAERIAEAFRAIEAGSHRKHFPIVIMNTKTEGQTVIEK